MFFLPRRHLGTKIITAEIGAANSILFDIPSSVKLVTFVGVIVGITDARIELRPNRKTTNLSGAVLRSFGGTRQNAVFGSTFPIVDGGEELWSFCGLFWTETGQNRNGFTVASYIDSGHTQPVEGTFIGSWDEANEPVTQIEFRQANDLHRFDVGSRISLYEVPLF